jgi:hypothetical protein
MYVGVIFLVTLADRIDYDPRTLSAGCIVQENQRFAAGNRAAEYRKIIPILC